MSGLSINMIIGVVIGIIVLAVAAMMTLGSDDDFERATGCFSQGGQCVEVAESECTTIDASCSGSDETCCRIGSVSG